MPTLTSKVIKGFSWVGGTRIVTKLFSFSTTIFLARLLTPEDFGLMAMAMVFIGLGDHLNQLGISAAIVQADKIDDHDLSTLLWLMLGINGVLLLGIAAAAPYIASFYQRPELTPIVLTLSMAFVASGIRIVPEAVLTKELEFDKLSKAEIAGSLTAMVIGPMLALMGFRVWALVAAILLNHTVVSAVVWWYRPILPLGFIDLHRIRRFLGFGLYVTGSRILWYVYSQSDRLLIGKLLGAGALGIYQMTLTLVDVAVSNVSTIANTVSYPAYAKVQKETQRLREHFLSVTKYVAMVSFPALAGLIVVREDFVLVILSEKWQSMLSVLTILAVVAMARSIGTLITPLLNAIGRPDLNFLLSLVNVVVFPAAFLFSVQWGIVGVATAWLVLYPTVYGIYLLLNCARFGLTLRIYAKVLRQPFILTTTMAGCMLAVHSVVPGPGTVRLIATVATGLMWYIGFVSVSEREAVVQLRLAMRGQYFS